MSKYVDRVGGEFTQKEAITASAGAGDAGKIPATDSGGKLDVSLMPDGFGNETQAITASENLAEGDFVNVFNDSGTLKVRKADNSNGRRAHGVVLATVSSGGTATVYRGEARTAGYTGLTIGGNCWLGTAGRATQTAPSGSGVLSQQIGFAASATQISQQLGEPVTLV